MPTAIDILSRAKRRAFGIERQISVLRESPMTVTFSGGLGAQILSLAIVLDYRARGVPVGVDLSYFSLTPHVAELGGIESIWDWSLDDFGFSRSEVYALATCAPSRKVRKLADSPAKFQLAVEALSRATVSQAFHQLPSQEVSRRLGLPESLTQNPYVAFHLRRGDYLNVSSYVVPDENYLNIVQKVSKVVRNATVASDSKLSAEFKDYFEMSFDSVRFLEGHNYDAIQIHHLLRNASIQVGSNGSFSLTAGLLGQGLWLSPSVWFGANSPYDRYLSAHSQFDVRFLNRTQL